MEERLQKIIARAGVCSRREAERLIADGKVTVNGDVITELGSKADAKEDHIKVNGKLVQPLERFHYLLMYKPKGVVTSVSDPENRPVVLDLVKGIKDRIYPVGRLDFNTEGALLLTNDGEMANSLLHPGKGCPKTYIVKVHGEPDDKDLHRLGRGITVDGTRYGNSNITILKPGKNTWLQVILTEGKNQQIRKMFEHIGHPVAKLKRIGFGFLTLKGLAPGEWRELSETEVARLKRGDYTPLMPINPYIFLKDYGVSVDPRKLKAGYMRKEMEKQKAREQERGPRGRGPGGRDGRRPYGDRDNRRSGNRNDRRGPAGRDDRRGPGSRDDRRGPGRDDRRGPGARDDRRGPAGRDDRRGPGNRDRKPYAGRRDDRRGPGGPGGSRGGRSGGRGGPKNH
ncbi:MAG: pseudouridine synthase [Acidobacteriota bacterium]|nr:pseudouridine synthase [Acidobacteriota bacterium]